MQPRVRPMAKKAVKAAKIAAAAFGAAAFLTYSIAQATLLQPVQPLHDTAGEPAAAYATDAWQAAGAIPAEQKSAEMLLGHVQLALARVGRELEAQGISATRQATTADLEEITRQTAPYVAHELNLKRVNQPGFNLLPVEAKPKLLFVYNVDDGAYDPLSNSMILRVPTDLRKAKSDIAHEFGHAQLPTLSLDDLLVQVIMRAFGISYKGVIDETFVEILTSEVEASQALAGDGIARLAFLMDVELDLRTLVEKGQTNRNLSKKDEYVDEHYKVRPANITVRAMNGEISRYGRIRLDATVALLSREIARNVSLREQASKLEKHCSSPESVLWCGPAITGLGGSPENPGLTYRNGLATYVGEYYSEEHGIMIRHDVELQASIGNMDFVRTKAVFDALGVKQLPLKIRVTPRQGEGSVYKVIGALRTLYHDANGGRTWVYVPITPGTESFYVLKEGTTVPASDIAPQLAPLHSSTSSKSGSSR